jgi:hypothetical protein
MDIECINIPSYHLLRELDRNSAFKDTAAFHGEVTLRSERYYDLVVKPQEFAAKYPVMSATEMLSMIDDHHLLQPCAGEPHFKCNCKEHFQYAMIAICPHSNLVKMLWFPDCQVPEDYSVALVPSRHKQRRPGVFDTVPGESTFQDKETVRRSWNPSGMAGEKMSVPDSDDDDFEEPAASKRRKKRKAHVMSVPSMLPEQPQTARLPARIAAMSEPDRYFFQEWLASIGDRALHLSDNALIKIFSLETRQRVPALSKDPAYPLDPKLISTSKVFVLQHFDFIPAFRCLRARFSLRAKLSWTMHP